MCKDPVNPLANASEASPSTSNDGPNLFLHKTIWLILELTSLERP